MQTLIDLIINKIEDSKVNWRENAKGNRSFSIQQEHLDSIKKHKLLIQAEELERAGLIQCEPKWTTGRSDIYTVTFSLDNTKEFYNIADKIPKSDRIKELKKAIEEQISKVHKSWIRAYYVDVLKSLEEGKGKEPEEFNGETRELNFKCFLGLDNLEGAVYKKAFSKYYLGGSKVFDPRLQSYVASVAKKYYEIIVENMTESEILSHIYLDQYANELALKGDLLIQLGGCQIDRNKIENPKLKELAEVICLTGIGIEQECFLF